PNPSLLTKALKHFFKVFLSVNAVIIGFFTSIAVIGVFSAIVASDETATQSSAVSSDYQVLVGEDDAEHQFASIAIDGIILGDRTDFEEIFEVFTSGGVTFGYDIKDELYSLAEEEDVAGVILEINSPGGTIFGTQAIVDGVSYYKQQTGKPVVAYVGSIAASGGYWAAVSADEIIADAGTTIGSIGVITGPVKFYDGVLSEDGGAFIGGVETKNGVQTTYFTAGEGKDMGNPYRPMTDRERQVLQGAVDSSHSTFVDYVSERRAVDRSRVINEWGGFIYNDIQAVQMGMVDSRGSKDAAYSVLAERAGVATEDSAIIRYHTGGGFFDQIFGVAKEFRTELKANRVAGGCLFSQHVMAYHGDLQGLCF
ncbi:MAG: S49 family peptidase, partial [Microgenomates group bacterium]